MLYSIGFPGTKMHFNNLFHKARNVFLKLDGPLLQPLVNRDLLLSPDDVRAANLPHGHVGVALGVRPVTGTAQPLVWHSAAGCEGGP